MKILSFSPYYFHWKISYPRSVILESLEKSGHEIEEIRCKNAFDKYCYVMMSHVPHRNSSSFTDKEKINICNQCKHKSNLLEHEFNIKGLDIEKLSNEQEHKLKFEIDKINRKNYLNYSYKEINIGRFCMSEIILMTKKKSFDLNNKEWDDYIFNIRNSIIIIDYLDILFHEKKYDLLIINNGFYSVMKSALEMAKKFEIKTLDINQGRNFDKVFNSFLFSPDNDIGAYQDILNNWHNLKNFPLTEKQMLSTTDHYNNLISESSNYTFIKSKKTKEDLDLRALFNIKKDKKIILICTSSEDEVNSYKCFNKSVSEEKLLFETQMDWIKNILEFSKKKQHIHFVIRVHPREYSNYSHTFVSEAFNEISKILENKTENVSINSPDQKLSIFDIIEEVDLVLNSWSSVGKDLSLLGLPVISYGVRNLLYPSNINIPLQSNKIEDYFKLVEESLNLGWDYKRIVEAYRWSYLEFDYATLNINDSVKLKNNVKKKKKIFPKIFDYIRYLLNTDYHSTKHLVNRPAILNEREILNRLLFDNIFNIKDPKNYYTGNTKDELQSIKNEMRKIFSNLYKDKKRLSKKNTLRCKLEEFIKIN